MIHVPSISRDTIILVLSTKVFYVKKLLVIPWSIRFKAVTPGDDYKESLRNRNLDLGYPFSGQNMILTRKNMRNVLFSNYHKLKKIREITICNFEKSISLMSVFT